MPACLLVMGTLLANATLAADLDGKRRDMMGGGFMLAGMALLALLFIALILAILSLVKYLFFSKS